MSRKPWERRLEDLAQILRSCATNYFEPDLFRRNVNNFLQTARTVTFIIQKNKTEIPNFNSWYQTNVVNQWKDDLIMEWAKESRNKIEKEGDLELYSTLRVVLLFSYLEEEDVQVCCGREELLRAGVKKLINFAQKNLPTGVASEASIKIERAWITSNLQAHELLYALCYVYNKLFECSNRLAKHSQRRLPRSIPRPTELGPMREEGRQIQMVKLKNLESYRVKSRRIRGSPAEALPQAVRDSVIELIDRLGRPSDFESTVAHYTSMAEITFAQWCNHVPMLFLIGRDWIPVDVITPELEDQADKYFFWRTLAERIQFEDVNCLVYTTEVWLRELKGYPTSAIKDLPIVGEQLQLCVFDRAGNFTVRTWPIVRSDDGRPTKLDPMETAGESDKNVYFLVPAMRSMGIEPDFIPKHIRGNG